jgi:hypothetical protein
MRIPRRKGTPINGGPRKRIAGDNDDDGGRRLEKSTKPTNRTGNQKQQSDQNEGRQQPTCTPMSLLKNREDRVRETPEAIEIEER